jgi:hypothetical protein
MDVSSIILQDYKATLSAFDKDDFSLVNIFANRIMTNAVIGAEPKYTLIGFFLKEVSRIYGRIKSRQEHTAFFTAKSHGDNYVKSLNLDDDIQTIWKKHLIFLNKVREYYKNEFETGNYEDNEEFSTYVFDWLIKKLDTDKDILYNKNNYFFKGILNEMNRIFNLHGGGIKELYALTLIRALDFYHNYLSIFNEVERIKIIKEDLMLHVEKTITVLSKADLNSDEVTYLLQNIIRDWRNFFIHFMEFRQLIPVPKREGVQITEETRKKISETVTKALEEEMR